MSTAYTYPYNTIVNKIVIECNISLPYDDSSETDNLKALWDTGAMSTCISNEIAQNLNLTKVNTTMVKGANNEPFEVPVYIVRLRMGEFVLPMIQVLGLPMEKTDHEVIIGMDIISKGDLSITNYEGKTVITFREPSIKKIDYVEELRLMDKCYKAHIINLQKRIPDKCACGSGRDFKNCHGKSPYYKH